MERFVCVRACKVPMHGMWMTVDLYGNEVEGSRLIVEVQAYKRGDVVAFYTANGDPMSVASRDALLASGSFAPLLV